MISHNIKTTIGVNCIAPQDGQALYRLICSQLKRGECVILDFSGVQIIAPPFLNSAIRHLLGSIPSEDLFLRLNFINMPDVAVTILERVIYNAKGYYANEQVRLAVYEAIKNEIDEAK